MPKDADRILAWHCAALGDVTGGVLLAVVVGIARAEVGGSLIVIGLTIVFVAAMLPIGADWRVMPDGDEREMRRRRRRGSSWDSCWRR